MSEDTWYSGLNDYIKYVYTPDPNNKLNKFDVHLQDTGYPTGANVYEEYLQCFENGVPKKVELLFSGGLDSEFVLDLLLECKIPVECITMELTVNGIVINSHDMYYSEKICRSKGVNRRVVSLDAKKFFESGEHRKYLDPYRISIPHVASHFWLIEQCSSFPIFGGEYHWAWNPADVTAISPSRHSYAHYEKFMKDLGMSGFGNMINHHPAIDIRCIKEHIKLLQSDPKLYTGSSESVIYLKTKVYETVSGKTYEPRLRSFGWERLDTMPSLFDRLYYRKELLDDFGDNSLSISWGNDIAQVLGGQPGTWSRLK